MLSREIYCVEILRGAPENVLFEHLVRGMKEDFFMRHRGVGQIQENRAGPKELQSGGEESLEFYFPSF